MYNDLLEIPQRVIASARIGMRPSPADIEAALRCLDKAQAAMRRDGRTALALDTAHAALVSLRYGHLPQHEACIAAVASLGAVMASGMSLEDA